MVSGESNIVSPEWGMSLQGWAGVAKSNGSTEIKIRYPCVVSYHVEYFALCFLDRVHLNRTSLKRGIK